MKVLRALLVVPFLIATSAMTVFTTHRSMPISRASARPLTVTNPCQSSQPHHRPPRQQGPGISVACARSGQGYPLSIGTEYIAVSPAAAATGERVHVWGNCGCGTSTSAPASLPVETVRLWLLGAQARPLRWRGHTLNVNEGRALLGHATLDTHSDWSTYLSLPHHIGAAFGTATRIGLKPGVYAIMVTYPGEEAGPAYYAVAPHEGYITRLVITRGR